MFQLKRFFETFYTQRIDRHFHKIVPFVSLLMMVSIFLSGCATSGQSVVKSGDQADVHFTCRFNNGEIAISTYQDVATNNSLPKSKIFLPRDRDTPLQLTAGKVPKGLEEETKRGFEGEIMYQVAKTIVGLPVGQVNMIELRTEKMPEEQKGEYMLQMARVRYRPKEIYFKTEDYTFRTGKTPEVGQSLMIDQSTHGTVTSVTEEEIIVLVDLAPGARVSTFFGEGTINELPDKFEIVIDARPGSLVRNVGYVGRIVIVENDLVTMDFSHPFGGELLLCDVLVELVSPAPAQAALEGEEVVGQESKSEKSVTTLEEKQSGSTQSVQKTVKWTEDHDEGLALAKKDGKPAAMVLYADWCGWCKKLINESFQAPTVQEVEEELVLIKVNSDKQKEIYAQYQQKGYPLLVLFDREGKVAQRINGYVDAAKLRKALDELLKG